MTKEETVTTISWIAIVLAISSLALSMLVYNRTDTDITSQLQEETQVIENEAHIISARAEARVRLATVQARFEADEFGEEVAREISEIQTDLNDAYSNASMETQQEMAELDREFNKLQSEARENSANALETVQRIIETLEQDIRPGN